MKAQDEQVRLLVVNGCTEPMVVRDGSTIFKPTEMWTQDQLDKTLYNGVSPTKFIQICMCNAAKEAWDILIVTHDETKKVKRVQLQR